MTSIKQEIQKFRRNIFILSGLERHTWQILHKCLHGKSRRAHFDHRTAHRHSNFEHQMLFDIDKHTKQKKQYVDYATKGISFIINQYEVDEIVETKIQGICYGVYEITILQ